MNSLEKLISHLCPEGVPYRSLDDIAEVSTGTQLNRSSLSPSGKYPVMNGGISPSGYHEEFNAEGPIIVISQGGASAGYVSWMKSNLWVGAHCFAITNDEENTDKRFLYHFLKHSEFEIQNMKTGAGIPGLSRGKLVRLRCPAPPLKIQQGIARMLDGFTELEAELEAELVARRIQYEYFSKLMLDSKDAETERVSVSDVCHISRGSVISKDYLRAHAGDFPVYSSQTLNNGIFGYIDTYAYDFESLTWTTDGANAGSIFFHKDEKFTITNVCGLLQVRDPARISTRFLYYVLSAEAPKHVSAGMGNPKLMAGSMGDIQINLPPIEKQLELVNVLDKFDLLVNGMTGGLPAEIAARRAQYEHYRSKLFTFKELELA